MVRSSLRPPPGKESKISTDSPPFVSYGKGELQLVGYILSLGSERFNNRQFYRKTAISRSTTSSRLMKLQNQGCISGYRHGMVKVTKKGKRLYEAALGGSKASRKVCRRDKISNHKIKYILEISERKDFHEYKIKEILPLEWKKVKLPNRVEYILYFDDATLIIKTKQINILIHDLVNDSTDSGTIEKTNIFFKYLEKITALGIKTLGVTLESEHYARVRSAFSESLEKIDEKYFLDLGDGKRFYIDHSDDHLEEETNDEEVRKNLDAAMKRICNGDLMRDVEGLKDIARMMLQRELVKLEKEKNEKKK